MHIQNINGFHNKYRKVMFSSVFFSSGFHIYVCEMYGFCKKFIKSLRKNTKTSQLCTVT